MTSDDVFQAIRDGGWVGHVELHIDAGYSGNWCHIVESKWAKAEPAFRDFESIFITTSTDCDQNSQ